MKYIIDRLEEGLALCEDELKKIISIPRTKLPEDLKEGDIIHEDEGVFSLDPDSTRERREAMKKKLMDLFE